jgi:hypothetical protein
MNWCTEQENIIHIESDLKTDTPVYLHYKIDNFLQNYKRYVLSRSFKQMAGESWTTKEEMDSDCYPVYQAEDLHGN